MYYFNRLLADNKLYLYREGDECIDVTGGWTMSPYWAGATWNTPTFQSSKSGGTLYAKTTSISTEVPPSGDDYTAASMSYQLITTINPVDYADYARVVFEISLAGVNTCQHNFGVATSPTSYKATLGTESRAPSADRSLVTIDLAGKTGAYIAIRQNLLQYRGYYKSINVYNIWLE